MNVIPFPTIKWGRVYGPQGELLDPPQRIRKALERRSQRTAALTIARMRGWHQPPAVIIPLTAQKAADDE